MQISFHDTHAYPGCPATLVGAGKANDRKGNAVAEFSDGSIAPARYERLNTYEMIVRVNAYTTARGTRIPTKAWRLKHAGADDSWRVVAKLRG
jgi:hypothetical protein